MDKSFEKQVNKADSLIRKNKIVKAILILKEVVKKFPENPYGHYFLGVARLKGGLFNLAKESLEKANKIDPNHPEVLRSLGWVKIALGETENGRSDLRDSINLNLTDYRAYLDLAMSYFDFFDFNEGFAWFDRAKALNPKDKFVIENYEYYKKFEKEFSVLKEEEKNKIKMGKLDKEAQKKIRLAFLEKTFSGNGIEGSAAGELAEELDLSGYSEDMLIYKDDVNVMKNETKESILKKRNEIEKKLLELIKKLDAKIKLDDIKKIIYLEKDHNDLDKIILEFDRGQNFGEIKKILNLVNDAWNYFPHKCLGGISPAEKVLEHKK